MNALPDTDTRYLQQTQQLVRETHTQRATIDSLRETVGLQKQQYDDLAARHSTTLRAHAAEMLELRTVHERELHDAITAKDVAERKHKEIEELLMAAAQSIMQGLRANKGDELPAIEAPVPEWRRDLDSSIVFGPR